MRDSDRQPAESTAFRDSFSEGVISKLNAGRKIKVGRF